MTRKRNRAEHPIKETLSHGEIREAISVLDQALYNHTQWTDALNITLICHLQPDERDISPNAHKNCRFGQWYYNQSGRALRQHENFDELELVHREMHAAAAHLLALSKDRFEIPMSDYEQFTHNLKRLRLQVETLKHELEDEIYNLDSLTGAYSRVGMLTKLREQQELVKRKLESCVVVMIDIDKFKLVNDTYGHQVGDVVLAAFARHVMSNARPFDKLFRYGGEEFLLCIPHARMDAARDMIERIRTGLAELAIEITGHTPIHISASFGMSALDPDVSVTESIDRADKAVFAAKAAGRNQTKIWDVAMDATGS